MADERRPRVLIVDDDAAVRRLLAKVVELEGNDCETAESGEEALALVEARSFDLLVADKNLPGMDGIELVRLCRELRPGMPALVITAYGSAGSAQAAAAQGVVDYILKPIDVTAMRTRLRRALRFSAADAGTGDPDDGEGGRIAGGEFMAMVIEPDEAVREALVTALVALGHRVSAFADDLEAAAHRAEEDFDVLVARPETLREHADWLDGGRRWAAAVMPSRDLDRVIAGIDLGARAVLGPPFEQAGLRDILGAMLLELAAERLRLEP